MVSQHSWFRWFSNIDGFDGFATLMVSMVSQHWWFRWFRNMDGFDGFATLMVSMVSQPWWFRWFRNIDGFDGFATLMFLPKIQELFLLDIQELWSIEMTSLYNKNEKLVLIPKPIFYGKIWGRKHFFTKNLICSYGPSAHFGCSGFPCRHKKKHIFTFLVVLFARVMST